MSLHWRVIQTSKKHWLFAWKITWGIWWILARVVETLKIYTLMGYFCRKYVMFGIKNTKELCLWKVNYDFKNGTRNFRVLEKFSHKKLNSMLVKSSAHVLAEGMYSLDKSNPPNFNFLVISLIAWICPNFPWDFWN